MYDDEEEEMEEEMGDDGQGQSGQWFTADNVRYLLERSPKRLRLIVNFPIITFSRLIICK